MKKIRNNQGITLVSLAITVIVMMILVVGVTMSTTSTMELRKYNDIKQDIIGLSEAVKTYYLENGKLPIYTDTTFSLDTYGVPSNDRNPNDSGNYYAIDVSLLSKYTSINKGEGNKSKKLNINDLYVVNEESLTVYYLDGAVLDGKKHYTIVDTLEGGSFAEDYYAKVNLPIISVVTMESNGPDKTTATINDTVTLKMLSNYTLTKAPTVTIAGHIAETTWNGKTGIATYTFPNVLTEQEANRVGSRIEFKIDNYEANGRIGQAISSVTFGNGVVLCEKERTLKTGDYVNYTYDTVGTNYSLSPTVSGYKSNQSIPQTKSLKWRILSVNDDGSIDLISETSTDKDVYLYGALGYNNGVYVLNDICTKLYSNSSLGIKARSINIEDIEKQETKAGTTARKEYVYTIENTSTQYGKTRTFKSSSGGGNTRWYPKAYKNDLGAGINTTTPLQPASLDVPDPFKESRVGYDNPPTTETKDSVPINPGLTITQTYYNTPINSTNYGVAGELLSAITSDYCWIASRSVVGYVTHAGYGIRAIYKSSNTIGAEHPIDSWR